jgi:hypothetical protein
MEGETCKLNDTKARLTHRPHYCSLAPSWYSTHSTTVAWPVDRNRIRRLTNIAFLQMLTALSYVRGMIPQMMSAPQSRLPYGALPTWRAGTLAR